MEHLICVHKSVWCKSVAKSVSDIKIYNYKTYFNFSFTMSNVIVLDINISHKLCEVWSV